MLARGEQGARPAIYFCQHGAATVRIVQVAPAPPVKGSKEKQARRFKFPGVCHSLGICGITDVCWGLWTRLRVSGACASAWLALSP